MLAWNTSTTLMAPGAWEPFKASIAKFFVPPSWRRVCHTSRSGAVYPSDKYVSLLAAACRAGDGKQLERLLQESVAAVRAREYPYDQVLPIGTTPLMLAVMYDHLHCVQLMIASGADLDARCGPDLEAPLHVSCARGRAGITKALIAAKADVGAADAAGRSPLLVACMVDQPECASLLLAAGADVEAPMKGSNPGATALYAAAYAGSKDCVTLLCDAGARVNARTFNDSSPMLAASQAREGRNRRVAAVLAAAW